MESAPPPRTEAEGGQPPARWPLGAARSPRANSPLCPLPRRAPRPPAAGEPRTRRRGPWPASCVPACSYFPSTCRDKGKVRVPPSAINRLIYSVETMGDIYSGNWKNAMEMEGVSPDKPAVWGHAEPPYTGTCRHKGTWSASCAHTGTQHLGPGDKQPAGWGE